MKVITKTYPGNWDYLNLYPISDTHIGAQECRIKELKAYIEHIRQDPRAAVILAGDIINNGVKSSKTNVYTEIYSPRQQKRIAIDLFRPIQDKIVTAVAGNHERRTANESDQDVTEDMCDAWGVDYGGDMAFVKLSVGSKIRNNKPVTYMLCVTHGAGGGGLIGSGLNRSDKMQMAVEGVDIMISGHTHKPSKAHSARLVFDPRNNKVTERNTLLFVCTGWLNYGGYPTQGMMAPVAFYPDHIRLDGRSKGWG